MGGQRKRKTVDGDDEVVRTPTDRIRRNASVPNISQEKTAKVENVKPVTTLPQAKMAAPVSQVEALTATHQESGEPVAAYSPYAACVHGASQGATSASSQPVRPTQKTPSASDSTIKLAAAVKSAPRPSPRSTPKPMAMVAVKQEKPPCEGGLGQIPTPTSAKDARNVIAAMRTNGLRRPSTFMQVAPTRALSMSPSPSCATQFYPPQAEAGGAAIDQIEQDLDESLEQLLGSEPSEAAVEPTEDSQSREDNDEADEEHPDEPEETDSTPVDEDEDAPKEKSADRSNSKTDKNNKTVTSSDAVVTSSAGEQTAKGKERVRKEKTEGGKGKTCQVHAVFTKHSQCLG